MGAVHIPADAVLYLDGEKVGTVTDCNLGAPEHAATRRTEPDPRATTVQPLYYFRDTEDRLRDAGYAARQARDRDIAAWNKAVDQAKAAKRASRSRP